MEDRRLHRLVPRETTNNDFVCTLLCEQRFVAMAASENNSEPTAPLI
jgi:hypothetical protein